jgi:hypothetical protein
MSSVSRLGRGEVSQRAESDWSGCAFLPGNRKWKDRREHVLFTVDRQLAGTRHLTTAS